MKMSLRDLLLIRGPVQDLNDCGRRERYLAGDFPNSERTIDLDKRYRWDLFYGASTIEQIKTGKSLIAQLEGDYSDAHIDTALRSIVSPLRTSVDA